MTSYRAGEALHWRVCTLRSRCRPGCSAAAGATTPSASAQHPSGRWAPRPHAATTPPGGHGDRRSRGDPARAAGANPQKHRRGPTPRPPRAKRGGDPRQPPPTAALPGRPPQPGPPGAEPPGARRQTEVRGMAARAEHPAHREQAGGRETRGASGPRFSGRGPCRPAARLLSCRAPDIVAGFEAAGGPAAGPGGHQPARTCCDKGGQRPRPASILLPAAACRKGKTSAGVGAAHPHTCGVCAGGGWAAPRQASHRSVAVTCNVGPGGHMPGEDA